MTLNKAKINEYWQHSTATGWLDPGHPGSWGANVIGLYGDDAKYKAGEKLLSICWNCILQEPARVFSI